MKIGNQEFKKKGKTYIMGILNVTPDSFSDGGRYHQREQAMLHVSEMIKDGADVIDVGGESTRPNHTKISEEQEIERVVPMIRMIRENFDIPVSIDTYKSQVAKEALAAGADLVNDIWGLKYDDSMAKVIKEADASVCIMHNRENIEYQNFIYDVMNELGQSIQIAKQNGISDDRILLDPGVGFAKTLAMNLSCVNHLEKFHELNYPILLGTSRKSMIGLALDLPVSEREEGTLATTVMAVMKGCQFVRVHNVKANKRAIMMTEEIMRSDDNMLNTEEYYG
ncbi:MAG: dihydropteroate synthase [Velocimicrobium sp.]